jgi:hypothetical protein
VQVLSSLEDEDGTRCVDVFRRTDGSFGFKEFRRDPEDVGRWTLVGDYSNRRFVSTEAALRDAGAVVGWLAMAHPNKVL